MEGIYGRTLPDGEGKGHRRRTEPHNQTSIRIEAGHCFAPAAVDCDTQLDAGNIQTAQGIKNRPTSKTKRGIPQGEATRCLAATRSKAVKRQVENRNLTYAYAGLEHQVENRSLTCAYAGLERQVENRSLTCAYAGLKRQVENRSLTYAYAGLERQVENRNLTYSFQL